jgi:UDP-N-acetylmuramoyl-tripeptide--D-alanyl-D-alanine ligase
MKSCAKLSAFIPAPICRSIKASRSCSESDTLQADVSIHGLSMVQATLADLCDLLGAIPVHLSETALTASIAGISTDTRTLKPGELFLALQGENFDGHQFLDVAKAQGAIAAITAVDAPTSAVPQLRVTDTLAAYQAIARWWRSQFTIPVIAITGSAGKTTTKELIAAVLGQYGRVLKTKANYNNEIGVPKTLLELEPTHDFAVIEMGMRGPGEIACLAQIAQPDIAVITNVGTAHIGRLGSREAIAQAKCELLAELPKTSAAVLNADNALLMQTAQRVWSGQVLSYGLVAGDLRGYLLEGQTLQVEEQQFPLPLPGDHNALNYLAALAVARLLHLDWSPLHAGLQVTLPEGRAQRYQLAQDIVLLDETYNAGPESMAAALRLLAQTPGERRIAVLGAMRELGDHSIDLHQQLGALAAQLQLDGLLILGNDAEETAIAQGYSNATSTKILQFTTHAELVSHLQSFLKPGDRLLFKASHSVGLDRVVAALRSDVT